MKIAAAAAWVFPLLFSPAQDDRQAPVDRGDAAPADGTVPADLLIRARVTALTPAEPTDLTWRWGGEGLGGNPVRGTLGEKLPVGQWSPPMPVASFVKGRFPSRLFVTFMAGRGGKLIRDGRERGYHATEGYSAGVEIEFEISWKGKVLKTFKAAGPDGGTVGIVIPAYRLAGGRTPEDRGFLEETGGLLEHALRRAAWMESLPEAQGPRPKRFAVLTNLGGYGTGVYYGTRYTDRAIFDAECRTLRVLGVNGLVHPPDFLVERIRGGKAPEFARAVYAQLGGYPVPAAREGREVPEAGCPYAPGVEVRTREMIEQGLKEAFALPVEEVWWRTEDEIGAVTDRAPDGKAHLASCPRCAEGFRDYVRGLGLTPSDLGAADWSAVRPLNLWAKEPPALGDPGAARTAYHTAMFLNHASARLFTPLRDALARANEEKRKDPSLKRPWVYSFALRGNTFLMGGHSLDFFDFYRLADNALVYETSNRDARVWGWDSYLCDVGRVVSERQGILFGIYVKPHRGAPVQRALAAAARGARMIYWYTYGPEYAKGDTFAASEDALERTARAARLLGRAEEVLYGARPAFPAEVAVVNPRSSEIWARLTGGSPAPYENAKWIYTALAHAHLPMDPLDEVLLATEDLSRYKAIYVSGTNLTRAAARKLAEWVRSGGILYTSAGGPARDEANEPLRELEPVLGLRKRGPVELWYRVQAYRATQLEPYDDPRAVLAPVPAGAEVDWGGVKFRPVVGREVLDPAPGAEVLARFADGGAAAVRNRHGKGQAWTV